MNTTKYCAVVLLALTIDVGYSSDCLMAQPQSGHGHSSGCAGGCNHGGGGGYDSPGLASYGQAGQSTMRQNYQPQRMQQPFRGGDSLGGRMDFGYSSLNRAAYQDSSNSPYGRGGQGIYQMGREEFAHANDPAAGFSPRGGHEGCRGGCSHSHHGGAGHNSPAHQQVQPGFGGGMPYGNEADQAPQLNTYSSGRGNQSVAYGQPSSGRWFRMRQEFFNPQTQGGIGSSSEEMYSPSGPPPTSFGSPYSSGSSCGHAGCNHSHN